MWVRAARGVRALRRTALLLPLALTALALLLLPRPPAFAPSPRRAPPAPPKEDEHIQLLQAYRVVKKHIDNDVPVFRNNLVHNPPSRQHNVKSIRGHPRHVDDPIPQLPQIRALPSELGINKSLGEFHGVNQLVTIADYSSNVDTGGDDVSRRYWFMREGEQRPWKHDPHAKLFPEDSPGDDRVFQQLMYTLPKDENVPVKKILLANGFSAWGVGAGRSEFVRNKCPVDRCSITADVRDATNADAIIYKDHHTVLNMKRSFKQIWILYYLECPYHTASLRQSSFDVFNWTSTYRRDSDIVAPYERWVYYDPLVTEKDLDRNYAANKTKKVAWFVSNCHARNRRLQYARQLSKFIQVDIYGACGSHHCPRNDPNCLEMLDREYKFYLAFENSNCRDYITEKFFVNGLQHNILPIVMGARSSEYAAAAPHNSYIHVDEFANPEELAAYLRRLDEDDDLYNSYFKWKGTGEFINTYFFCRVCAMVHANERRQRSAHYSDVQAWWREGACTRATSWRGQDGRDTAPPPIITSN